ncbi:MAG: hypothetical protein K8R02_01595 [Anaerohalosphaeraceae bacterium]|nr:hypothetical protein [Anaerohalosphaeraceae bacterium]
MHLVKWIRKNMTKLMAIFVILIMVAFVVPQLLTQLSRPKFNSPSTAYWLYADDKKITLNDIKAATVELSVLSGLYTDKIFFSQNDLRMVLLGHMLFGQSVPGAVVSDQIKRMKSEAQLQVSNRKIDKFFEQSAGKSELLWILLRAEAKRSGCAVSTETAGTILKKIIPQITGGVSAAEVVKSLSSTYHMTENEILQIFADSFLVVAYANIVSEVEDITEAQLCNAFAKQFKTINAEAVTFNAESFLDKTGEPEAEQIAANFDKYKDVYPGQSSEDNPYGFGYKIGPRVQLEYMVVKCDDVKKLVAEPLDDELERYYQANLEQFTEQVKKDEQDPNSEMVSKQESYAEVASLIKTALLNRKIVSKSSVIINEAIELAEAGFADIDFATATTEDFKAKAGSYASAAAKIESKYGIPVANGKTGLISIEQVQKNSVFGYLMMQGQSRMSAPLAKLVFAIDELGVTALGAYEAVKPKVYLSIGPLFSGTSQPENVAAVRVVDYAPAQAAENVNYSYTKNMLSPDLTIEVEDNVVSIKALVSKDLKRVEAMQVAKTKASEFMAKVGQNEDWDKVAEEFQKSLVADYPEILVSLRPVSFARQSLSLAETMSEDMPMPELYMSQIQQYNRFVDIAESEFGPGQEKPRTLPLMIEYKPFKVYYCMKDMTREYGSVDYYNQIRGTIAYKQDAMTVQALIFDHYMPENINKRMNFRIAQQPSDSNESADVNDSAGADGDEK